MTNNIPEFGIKRDNEERRDGGCGIVFDPKTQKYAVGLQENGRFRVFAGGVDPDEDLQQGVIREVVEESGLDDFLHVEKVAEAYTHYYNSLRNVNRFTHSTCFLMILRSTRLIPVKHEEHEKFSLVWATAKELLKNWNSRNENKDYDHWIYYLEKSIKLLKELGYDSEQ